MFPVAAAAAHRRPERVEDLRADFGGRRSQTLQAATGNRRQERDRVFENPTEPTVFVIAEMFFARRKILGDPSLTRLAERVDGNRFDHADDCAEGQAALGAISRRRRFRLRSSRLGDVAGRAKSSGTIFFPLGHFNSSEADDAKGLQLFSPPAFNRREAKRAGRFPGARNNF